MLSECRNELSFCPHVLDGSPYCWLFISPWVVFHVNSTEAQEAQNIYLSCYVSPAGNQEKEIIFDKVRKSTRCLRKGKFPQNFIANGKGSSSQWSVSIQELPRLRSRGPQNLFSFSTVQSLMANESSEKAALRSDASDKPTV